MVGSDRPKGPRQMAHDQNTVAHLRESLARADSVTVSHVKQALNERQMTVSHLAKPVGIAPQNDTPAQPAPKPVSPSGTGTSKE
jgi:hypothetical protein